MILILKYTKHRTIQALRVKIECTFHKLVTWTYLDLHTYMYTLNTVYSIYTCIHKPSKGWFWREGKNFIPC